MKTRFILCLLLLGLSVSADFHVQIRRWVAGTVAVSIPDADATTQYMIVVKYPDGTWGGVWQEESRVTGNTTILLNARRSDVAEYRAFVLTPPPAHLSWQIPEW